MKAKYNLSSHIINKPVEVEVEVEVVEGPNVLQVQGKKVFWEQLKGLKYVAVGNETIRPVRLSFEVHDELECTAAASASAHISKFDLRFFNISAASGKTSAKA